MIKNVMFVAIVSLLTMAACKNKSESNVIHLDDKKNVLPQNQFGEVIVPKKEYKKGEFPAIEIPEANFDFGTINQGDKVEHVFKFKNIGKNDLYVMHAQASCGCTIPEWTKEPVKPGANGEIKIIFNSAGKSGEVQKTVTLMTNTEAGSEIISFKVNILTKNK
jgi:hypothetical protein